MEILRKWRDGAGTRFEGVCRFAVEQSTRPGMEKFEIVFTTSVYRFEVCFPFYVHGHSNNKHSSRKSDGGIKHIV